jgi:hypothetical protein
VPPSQSNEFRYEGFLTTVLLCVKPCTPCEGLRPSLSFPRPFVTQRPSLSGTGIRAVLNQFPVRALPPSR